MPFSLIPPWLGPLLTRISPVSLAVTLTSLCAAGLFVTIDLARTFGEAAETGLIGSLSAATVVPGPAFVATASSMPSELRHTRAGSAEASAGATSFGGVAQRGLGAFGLAFLASAVSFRRRREHGHEAGPGPQDTLAEVLAALPSGVAWWSEAGTLNGCNARFPQMLANPTQGLPLGTDYSDVLRRIAEAGSITMLHADETSRRFEVHRLHGASLLVEERTMGERGFMTLITDMSEQRRSQQLLASVQEEQRQLARKYHEEKLRAEAASHSKTAFLAHLSHDIRTPLNHIIGFAELIRHQTYGPLGDARYLTYIDTIKGSGERLLTFFASILDFAELESGQRELRRDPIGVDDLLDSAVRRFKAQASRAGIALGSGVPCGAMLLGDRFCLERMLANLLENALRFTPTGGRVTRAPYAASDGVVLEIADTGIGMTSERVSALSQPFALGDAAITKQGGSGLGVPIARAIAEQSGGHLAIDSRQGLGTTVAISLPLLASAQDQAAA